MAEAQREWTFGKHRAWFEAPDILVMKYEGPVELADAQRATDIFREVGSRQPFYALIHFGDATLDKAGRDYMTKHARAEWFQGLVGVGGNMVQRAISKAMMIALYVTGVWTVESDFTETEELARAAIARQREKRKRAA
jgi:hypothetical protein